MERLTERGKLGYAYYPRCFEECQGNGYSSKCDKCDYSEAICNKLAAYEDTKLSPEQVSLREDDIKLLQKQSKEMREEIYRLREELQGFRDTGLTPEEITQLEKSCECWHREAEKVSDELKCYRDAEEQGLLIKLPCKVGDTISYIDEYSNFEYAVEKITIELDEVRIYGYGRGCIVYARNFNKYCSIVKSIEETLKGSVTRE